MNLRDAFYRHPYAVMISAVFLFAVLVTTLYASSLIPGVEPTDAGFSRLVLVTGVLVVVTAASWLSVLVFTAEDP